MSSWSTSGGQLKTISAAGAQPTKSATKLLLAPLGSIGGGGGGWTLAEPRARKAAKSGPWAAAGAKPQQSDNRIIHTLAGGLLSTAPHTTGPEKQAKQFAASANLSWYRKVVYGASKPASITIAKETTTSTTTKKQPTTIANKGCPKQQQQLEKRQAKLNSKKQRKRQNSIIAHASSNFVDKLTYMIKKSNSSARNESDFVADAGKGEQQQQTGANKATEALAAAAATAKATRAAAQAVPSQKAGGSGNRYLLGELSRRLVKRCTKSRAVQCATRASGATGGSSDKSKSERSTTNTAAPTASFLSNNERSSRAEQQQKSAESSEPRRTIGSGETKLATGGSGGCVVGSKAIQSSERGSSSSMATAMAAATATMATAPAPLYLPASPAANKAVRSKHQPQTHMDQQQQHFHYSQHQHQQQHHQQQHQLAGVAASTSTTNASSGSTMATIAAAAAVPTPSLAQQHGNLDSSLVSTLSTAILATPSGCCYRASSPGLVSSGINCSDSIKTHSCSSSAYNDPAADQQQQQVYQASTIISSSGSSTGGSLVGAAALPKSPTTSLNGAMATNNAPVARHYQHQQDQARCGQQQRQAAEPEASNLVVKSQPRPQQLTLEVSKSEPTGASESGGSAKSGSSPSTSSKKKGSSFLSRARNSTINLASLATVTQRFNCSASAGNLWAHGAGSGAGGGNGGREQKRELAELSGDSSAGGVKPLDYTARGLFDDCDYNNNSGNIYSGGGNNNNQSVTAPIMSDAKQRLPLPPSPASASNSRKSSTKEKKRRQKEAEKVEKLRLLVSYLKSGASQQLLNPITLEADEIELAQKYKSSQIILCEECLKAGEQQQQTPPVVSAGGCGLSTGPTSSASIPASASNGRLAAISGSRSPDAISSIHLNRYNFELESPAMMFHQYHLHHHHCSHHIDHHSNKQQQLQEHGSLFKETGGGSGKLSPPALMTSCRSVPAGSGESNNGIASSYQDCKQAVGGGGNNSSDGGVESKSCSQRTRNAQSSNPHHIGNLPWGMRHSISDPGSNFERAQKVVYSAQGRMLGSATGGASSSGGGGTCAGTSGGEGGCNVAGGASYSYESCSSSAQISRRLQDFGQSDQHQPAACSSVQSPKSMFYIDEMERKNSDSSDTNSQLLASTHHSHNHHHNGNCNYQHLYQYRCDEHSRQSGSKATISSSEAIRDLPTRSWSSELFLTSTPNSATNISTISGNATGAPTNTKNNLPTVTLTSMTSTPNSSNNNTNNTNNISSYKNNGNTSIQTNSSSSNTVSPAASSSKTSAWTNPQTLATWIDNEVNSLVNDLEAKSQLVKSEKHVKSSKRKWLSSSSRRNSSGAHST